MVLRFAVLVVWPFALVTVMIVMSVLMVPDVEVIMRERVLVIDMQVKVIEPGERNVTTHKHSGKKH